MPHIALLLFQIELLNQKARGIELSNKVGHCCLSQKRMQRYLQSCSRSARIQPKSTDSIFSLLKFKFNVQMKSKLILEYATAHFIWMSMEQLSRAS